MGGKAEAPDVVAKNVTLHSQGRREHGSLELYQHHLVFCYKAKPPGADRVPNGIHSRNVSGQHISPQSAEKAADGTNTGTKDGSTSPRMTRVPERTIHIAYPLINYCYLRPSHAVSATYRGSETQPNLALSDDESQLFPPTHGTSSTRPSTDSTRLTSQSSPYRSASPAPQGRDLYGGAPGGRQPALRMRCKDFRIMAFHFSQGTTSLSPDETARKVFLALRSRCCVNSIEDMYAFHFETPKEEVAHMRDHVYDARREFARMGIGAKAAEGPGSAWRITDINCKYEYAPTYPGVLCVPRNVSDAVLKYGGKHRSKARIPALAYLHPNGGSITRASQPMTGLKGNRSAQDERLVSAIFTSQTPTVRSREPSPPASASPSGEASVSQDISVDTVDVSLPLNEDELAADMDFDDQPTPTRKKIYGSTRNNWILDARPKLNAMLNKASGGGMEDLKHYMRASGHTVNYRFLNIENIHQVRNSLDAVIAAIANSDYLDLKPSQEALQKSKWLYHIACILEGAEHAARVVGLGGSHVLVHCSDGWDRTAQISALAQVILSPYYRTLDGFITLIQKDFISFGHKFRDRNGVEGSEKWFEIENERITPDTHENGSENQSFNNLGVKAFSGAKSWFEKSRGNLFKQQNSSRDSLVDDSNSRPASPPPNPLIHSIPAQKEKKPHKTDENEIAPIFHQFLDAVYQLLYQFPDAFEFNERFLRRLFYQVYAGQYGEFLFNNERERSQHEGQTTTVWAHFLARRLEMTNKAFVPKVDDPLLFPKRDAERNPEVRWWASLFGRKDEEMNVPKSAPNYKPPALHVEGTSLSADDAVIASGEVASTAVLRSAKSTSALDSMGDSLNSSLPAPSVDAPSMPSLDEKELSATAATANDHVQAADSDFEILTKQDEATEPSTARVTTQDRDRESMVIVETGDPLGVMQTPPKQAQVGTGGLDFAAFASQNRFSER